MVLFSVGRKQDLTRSASATHPQAKAISPLQRQFRPAPMPEAARRPLGAWPRAFRLEAIYADQERPFKPQPGRYSRRMKALASAWLNCRNAEFHRSVVFGKREATPPSNTASVSGT